MAVDQENVTRILSALSHPTRREILLTLNEKSECSFTDLMNALGIDTGKLSFHIRNLTGLIEQTSSSKYILSKMGENAVRLLMDLQSWASELAIQNKDSSMLVARTKKRVYAFLIDFGVVLAVFTAASLIATVFSLIKGG
jgi:DNA-binding transcriptional ArsR family regulator